MLVQIEREEWRLVGLGRSCIVEGIGVEIGEESCNQIDEVIVVVNCKEGCRESNVRIGWMTDSLEVVEVVDSCEEVIVVVVVLVVELVVELVVVVVDTVVVVVVLELVQAEKEH